MKLNYILLGVLVIIILGFLFINHSLRKNHTFLPPDHTPPPSTRHYEKLPGNITLSVSEELSDKGTQIYLKLYTVKIYPCTGYRLNADFKIQGNTILVDIKGISSPEGGLGYTVPTVSKRARFSKDISKIEGNYLLIIRNGTREDKYNLSITKEEVRIDTISSSFTHLSRSRNRVLRFPLGSIKVRCDKRADDPHESLCDQFYKDLESIGATKSNKEYAKQLSRTHSVLYDYSGNLTALKNLVDKYSRYDYMSIEVWTPRGGVFYSWVK